ncbi:MAG: phage tail sheath family protein [Anaerotignum sp.]|nr:phage tail sheath family protein [Anaerotignum sp.]
MALGGGTYLVQNKVLPGAYINFVSRPRAMGSLGERGIVCVGMEMDWGAEGMMAVEAAEFRTDSRKLFGYDYLSKEMQDMRELFLHAKKVLVYRLNGGDKATATVENLTVTAKNTGKRGNDICIAVVENVDEDGAFDVETYLGTELVDSQTAANVEELKDNDFVTFSGTGALKAMAGTYLTGGTTAEVTGSGYTDFLDAAEAEDFNVLAYNGSDETTKKLFGNFTKRMREEEGVKFVTVLYDHHEADHEGIISVGTAKELVYWVAGATAGAEVNESLTNVVYDGEYEVDAKMKKSEYIKGIEAGQFLFYEETGELRVLRDINSFTSFEAAKNSDFSSNRVVRVLDSIANDVANIFSKYYLGKQSNNANGRNLLKAEILAYHEELMKIEAIEGFTADDITVEKGAEKQDVVVYESVQPVDAMEKLYMKVEVA